MADDVFGRDLDVGVATDDGEAITALGTPHSLVDLQPRTRLGVAPRARDLGVVTGRANLAQSLVLRLQTERGELEQLAHPDYGSRHHRLIGELNTESNRNLVKLYVLECLQQEPRLAEILRVDVRPYDRAERRSEVRIEIEARAREDPTPFSLVIPFSFAGPVG
jgi:phage baseplate assembly protein W